MMQTAWTSWIENLRNAAVLAAFFVLANDVSAQPVTFSEADGTGAVSGRFVAFDGDALTLITDDGLVSLRAAGLSCEGDDCPDLEDYVPAVRLAGSYRMADVLMPALIEVYARDNGYRLRETLAEMILSRPDGSSVISFRLAAGTTDSGFEALLAHSADGLMAMRELRPSELEAAAEAGLGRLNRASQARILALDALVPVVAAGSDRRSISINDLTDALSGLGETTVHLPFDQDGQVQGFEDRFMTPFGLSIVDSGPRYETLGALARGIGEDPSGIGLLPFGETGNAQPLSLTGTCGLRSSARFLSLKTEDYPLTFPMFLYLPERRLHPEVEAFLDWLRSPSAQLVIRRAGLVDLAATPIPLNQQGDRLANAIRNAGDGVGLEELQRMVRLLSPRVRMSSTFRFEPGSTRLDGQSRSNIMQLAQAIRDGQFARRELMFVGFSDGRGPALANRDLSAARAQAVLRDVERALGGDVPSNVLLEADAFGEAMPMACDDTVWGQQTNRRVELWVRDQP